jgi:AcrR family transcriptional regulator
MQRGIHKGLTPAKVLDESFAIVDADGPAALTMRGLARRLDVAPMAIYNHYQDRESILDALAERVFAELAREHQTPPAQSRQKWKRRLRAMVFSAHRLAGLHPHIYRLAMTRPNKPASAFVLMAEAMKALREAGLNENQATTVYHTFIILLHGFPFWREGFERYCAELTPGGTSSPEALAEKQFAASVDWLLSGVENFLPGGAQPRALRD